MIRRKQKYQCTMRELLTKKNCPHTCYISSVQNSCTNIVIRVCKLNLIDYILLNMFCIFYYFFDFIQFTSQTFLNQGGGTDSSTPGVGCTSGGMGFSAAMYSPSSS